MFSDLKLVDKRFKHRPFRLDRPELNHLSEFLDTVFDEFIRVVSSLSNDLPEEVTDLSHELLILAVFA